MNVGYVFTNVCMRLFYLYKTVQQPLEIILIDWSSFQLHIKIAYITIKDVHNNIIVFMILNAFCRYLVKSKSRYLLKLLKKKKIDSTVTNVNINNIKKEKHKV